jgi:hypothetical protein
MGTAYAQDQSPLSFLLRRQFDALPGQTRGLLVSGVGAALRAEGRSIPDDAVLFGRDHDSYRTIYVPLPDSTETVTLPVPSEERDSQRIVRERFQGYALARLALLRPVYENDGFAIVDVEVNGGRGSPAGVDRFAATKIRRVDGSPDGYLFSAAAAMRRAKEICASHGLMKDVQNLASDLLSTTSGQAPSSKPSTPTLHMHATWNSQAEQIEAKCIVQATRAEHEAGEGTKSTQGNSTGSGRAWGFEATVSTGLLLTISRAGEVLVTDRLPLTRDVREIKPPPVQSEQPSRR